MDTTFWNIYKVEQVYVRQKDGRFFPDALSLDKIAEGLRDFGEDCWPIIKKTKEDLIAAGAWEGPLSRSENYCVDWLTRYATEEDKVRDDMFPEFVNIKIIATTFELVLK